MTIETFIQEYNKRIDWDLDILNKYNINLSNDNSANEIIKDYLGLTKINHEDYDIDNAELYEYAIDNGKQTFELQVYSFTDYCHKYFWVRLEEEEDEYKENKINTIKKELTSRYNEVRNKLLILENEKNELDSVLKLLNN
jgi:predicted nuclease with TOPRIM domain